MSTIDRDRLRSAFTSEQKAFVAAHPRSAQRFAEARSHLLGGVPMAWMARWPGSFPIFVAEAEGARIVDVDGCTYVDLALGDTGAMCGHALPFVTAAISRQAELGATTMLPSEDVIWVGEALARRFGLPVWQLAMTATDANRFVIRLARHLTGRPKVLVFDWCYHGTVDEALVTMDASGRAVPRSGNAGPPVDPALTTVVVPFNDAGAVAAALQHRDVACVLAEPALTNIGIVLPEPGFHEALRDLTRRAGTFLVIDETHTICTGPGGYTAEHGLAPDFLTIGKAIAGGVPAAAFGMTVAIAERLAVFMEDDDVDVSGVGGTLTGNALTVAAMRAALENALREEDFAIAVPLARRWADGVASVIADRALPWSVQRLGCRAEYWFCPPPRTGAEAAAAVDHELDAFFHLWCLNRGILLTPFHNMALFSPAHLEADVDMHTEVFAGAVRAVTGS